MCIHSNLQNMVLCRITLKNIVGQSVHIWFYYGGSERVNNVSRCYETLKSNNLLWTLQHLQTDKYLALTLKLDKLICMNE